MTPPRDPRLSALRREIRSAGSDSCRMRTLLGWGSGLALLLLVAGWIGFSYASSENPILGVFCMVVFSAAPVVGIGYSLALPLADRYQRAHRHRLLRQLVELPPPTSERVLLSLRHIGGDTSELVEQLILDLRASPTELTPAAAPEGRGDEPSPDESRLEGR